MAPLQTVVAFEAYGARIRVQVSDSVGDTLQIRLPPGAGPTTGESFDTTYTVTALAPFSEAGAPCYELARDGVAMGSTRRLSKVRLAVESDLHFHVARAARGYLFVHAGVVEWQGRAVVLPGRTHSGKSSLVLALVRAGAKYFSDEFAVFEQAGRILPYPKPLSERRHGAGPRLHPPEQLGTAPADLSVPLGLVAVVRFRSSAHWNPRPLSRAESLMALFDNTLVAQTNPDFALAVLARALDGSDGLESERGDASEAAAELLNAQRPLRN
jgi:hypothetical protein